jgi:hypothetical protein
MKTLADLKRDAASGRLNAVMIERYGEKPEEKYSQKRKITRANTVSIFFDTNGKESALEIPRASLVEYDGKTLTIYAPGFRDLNTEEAAIMVEWDKITKTERYQEDAQRDAYTDGTSTFYQERSFFRNHGKMYLMGCDEECGLKYDYNKKQIRDKSIKGDPQLKYNIFMEE